jgi:methylmalonyl-CoA/ethylmalonyl-CoA epimerase
MVQVSDLQIWHHHGALSVPDLDASIDWYGKVLGFELLARHAHPKVKDAELAMLRNGSMHIELFMLPDAVPAAADRSDPHGDLLTHGHKHVAFAVRNVDLAAEELRRRNADIVFVARIPSGAVIYLRDNAGNLIEFVEVPDAGGSSAPDLVAGSL